MEEISVTEEQHEFLEQLRQELSEQVVGPYGTVRQRDAVQFLIDNLDDDALTAAADEAASATTSLAESGAGADGGVGDDDGETDADGDDETTDTGESGDADDDTDDAVDDDPDDGGSTPASGGAGDDDRLSAMMNLLETHDDKWEKGDSPEARYVVTLPDGETEQVKTKDDVKALLFKNY